MQKVVPAIRIKSYRDSKSFFESLGFREQWTHQFEPGFPIFASMERDGMQVFLTEHAGDCQFGSLVHFYVADVDALYEELAQKRIAIAEPPNNGLGPELRSMSVVDGDGNRLKFLTLTSR